MRSLYLSQQGCRLSLDHETLQIHQGETLLDAVQLPLIEHILIFGHSEITTPALQACLYRQIPIVYLTQTGRCYGRLLPLDRQYPRTLHHQLQLSPQDRLRAAQQIVQAKLRNSRVLLMRQQRRLKAAPLEAAICQLDDLAHQATTATDLDQLLGFEGAGAASYFRVFNHCISHPDFTFSHRTRRPPTDPVNALLSFGYQLLWNHLLMLIDLNHLDPYSACLHQATPRHPALASDLIEEFRAPIVDALVLYLINKHRLHPTADFTFTDRACYLNDAGRKLFLQAFIQRMNETTETPYGTYPRWNSLNRQVKEFVRYVYDPRRPYRPYTLR